MKNIFFKACLICILASFSVVYKSFGATYDIDTYYGTPPSAPTALLNRGSAPAFASGDTLNFLNDLTASNSSINNLGTFVLNITGNNKTIDGANTFGGFSVLTGSNYTFDTINLNNFTNANGSAIYNTATTNPTSVINSTFSNNTATALGGAIYNAGTMNIVANANNTVFTGNADSTGSNALYNNNGTLRLNAGNGGYILFDDKVAGTGTNTISINPTNGSYPTSGNVIFNNTLSNANVTLSNGTMTLGEYNNPLTTYLPNGGGVSLTLNGGILNTANKIIDTNYVSALTGSASSGLFYDVNLSGLLQQATTSSTRELLVIP